MIMKFIILIILISVQLKLKNEYEPIYSNYNLIALAGKSITN